jgi:integrase
MVAAGSLRKKHSAGCPAGAAKTARCRCSATWSYRLTAPGGRRLEKSGFTTKAEAQKALTAQLKEVDEGTWRQLKRIGFADLAERWLATYALPNVKPTTYTDYRGSIRNHLVPYFGNVALTEITREHVESYLAAKLAAVHPKDHPTKAGQPVWSRKTIHNTFIPLREMLSHAIEWGYLTASPAQRVRPPKADVPEKDCFAWEEIQTVCAVAGEPWAMILRTAARTTLRKGELLGLRWSDVELDAKRLFVRQTYNGAFGFGTPKSRAGRRMVPLTPALAAELRRHKLAQAPNPTTWCSPPATGRPSTPATSTPPGPGRCARRGCATCPSTRPGTPRSAS